jgi:hypothetical protein
MVNTKSLLPRAERPRPAIGPKLLPSHPSKGGIRSVPRQCLREIKAGKSRCQAFASEPDFLPALLRLTNEKLTNSTKPASQKKTNKELREQNFRTEKSFKGSMSANSRQRLLPWGNDTSKEFEPPFPWDFYRLSSRATFRRGSL